MTAATLPPDEYLDTDQVASLHELLLAQLESLVAGSRDELRNATEERRVEPDEVDFAVSESNRAYEIRMADRERRLLGKVRRALHALSEGTYGTCERCGDEIGFPRLLARPVARLCIDCKTDTEQLARRNRAF